VRLHNLFAAYFNLNCFFVPAGHPNVWKPLFYSRDTLHNPTHFESFFRKLQDRDRFNELNFNRLMKERKALVATHRGFSEIFTPVVSGGACQGILAAGSFVREPFTEAELGRQWADLSGRPADAPDPDYLSYARMALGSLVLNPPALEDGKKLLQILADYLCGRADEGMAGQLEELRKGALSHCLPHFMWMDFMIGLDKFHPRVTAGFVLHEWEKEELGITRYPTTVLAVTQPVPAPGQGSTIRAMVRANRLQWEALWVAREFPETVAGKLEDYGALFVTSASPSLSKVQAKLEIRERMEAIQARLEKRTGLKLLAGVGNTLSPGDKLVESRYQAILAMNLCPSLGRSLAFYEDHAEKIPQGPGRGLRPALARLRKAYQGGSLPEREVARAEFIRQALHYSQEHPESLRAHLLQASFFLADSMHGNSGQKEKIDVLADSLEERLLRASTTQDMLSFFRDGLDKIGAAGDRPSEGGRLAHMEEMRRFVDQHFTGPLRLKELARKAGLSQPAFLKGFQRATGHKFSKYLQALRLEEAKRLLRVSPLSVERVAQESGFNSASYFVQAFKRATGHSPGSYRKMDQIDKKT
jgi:AraC-like DNA-binding protein